MKAEDQAPKGPESAKPDAPKEAQGEAPARKPRRRRSPYQTSGVKNRDGKPADATGGEPSTRATSESVPHDKAIVEKPAQPLAEQPRQKPEPRAESKPEPKPEQKSEPRAESKPKPEPKPEAQAKPEPKPQAAPAEAKSAAANVVKDQNGIYTLKPSKPEAVNNEKTGAAE